MSSPTYADIVLQLTSQIDVLTQSFIFNGYQALAAALAKPLASLCVLFIILMGYGMIRGLIKTPMQEFGKLVIRMGVVYMLAMNWSFFSSYMVDLFIGGASELGAVLMKASPIHVPTISGHGVNNSLQSVLIEVIRVGSWTWDKATFKHWGPIFTAIMIYLSGLAVIGFTLFELIVAKLMLAVCLASAPLFFCFTLFEQTKSFFDRWLGTLVGFSLLLVMVSSVVGLFMHLIHWAISGHYLTHAVNVSAVDWIPICLVACFCIVAILEVVRMAKQIGGACSTSNGSAMVGGFVSGALGAAGIGKTIIQKAMSAAKVAAPTLSNSSNQQGQQLMSGIQNHMRGNS